ncbi:S1C family serine protease [Kitasatospora cheerisanensis]|uniref:Putative peptidase S01 family protein n=1 Tax=Kitasatospora cheerisanensis KCTC 2395 TaxID=1348663 RepID=A0A066Z105_9ACTN|nr:trypsin-like peptidase domain-containing protein [Kitasatospora cheerisanensis]KDN84026.1 putative peptidase S01 family protein [Kitasatospora cheerisanensis KCTC 2395]
MSTEHASGTTPPEKAPEAAGTEAGAASSAPAYLDAPPPVLPAAPAAPEADHTIQLGKVPAAPAAAPAPAVDAPPPFQNPYGSVTDPNSPYARPAVEAPTAVVPAVPPAPYAQDGAPGAYAQDGASAAGAPGEAQHPFGAGHPVGGWAQPSGGAAGGPGEPGSPWAGPQPPAPAGKNKRGSLVALVAAVALVAGLVGGAIGASVSDNGGGSSNSGSSHSSTTVAVGNTHQNLDRAPESVAGIAAKALPSTVTIKASGSSESGTGTGFVFDTEGHILTNNHVVAPAAKGGKLSVKFSDGSSYDASVVGRAEGYDVAVIRLDNPPKDKLNPLPLGDSDKVAIGDATIAIGAPYGLEGTVTTGIISAKDRPVASGDETGANSSYMNALQTDASINPGNSGGPLLDGSGSVIGINSAIQSNTSGTGRAGSIGLGFAIPINQAKWVAQTLIKDGTPVYAILGVLRNDDYRGDGAQIATAPVRDTPAVTPGGPADQAGLKAGDVITKLGGISIDSGPTLVSEIWTHKPGEKVEVEYTRDGKAAKTTVTLGERKGDN